MEPGHFALYEDLALCDFTDDGNIEYCELVDCIIMVENAWRE